MFIYRDYKWSELPLLVGRVVRTVGMVMIMIGFSVAFGYMMAIMQVPAKVTEFFVAISSDKYMFLLYVNILLLVLGTFMDLAPMLLICTPIFLPVIKTFGIDPVHFGIIMILNLGIGLLTPPVGPTLVVGCAIGKVTMEAVSRSILVFYIPMLIVLGLVTYIPALSLWLPRVLGICRSPPPRPSWRCGARSAIVTPIPPQRGCTPEETMKRRDVLKGGLAFSAAAVAAPYVKAQAPITLHGASQFNDDHAFTKALVKFEELTQQYYGKPINFVLHKNSELGLEKDYFAYMSQGISVDYAIVSPAHMSTFSKAAPFIDAPFLFRDLDHWNKVLDEDILKPVADEIAQKADVMLIGYAGGGTRNIFSNKPATHPRRAEGPQGPRAGRADLEQDLRGDRHVADRDRLQRGLQRDPERRHQRRRERGGRRRVDEVLRGRAEPPHDRARDHDPAPCASRARPSRSCRRTCRRRSSRPARRAARMAARSSRARTRRSSTRSRRPAS